MAFIVLGAVTQAPAHATAFHQYSVAYESSNSGHYTGAQTYRIDPVFQLSTGSTCTTPYTAPVVYTPLWVNTTQSSTWFEIGTAHQCNGYRYWYAGYGLNGIRYSLWAHPFANSYYETYTIQRRSTIFWDMKLSGTTEATVDWNSSIYGSSDQVGLESYDAGATAPKHTYQSLKFSINDGVLQSWAGFDSRIVQSPMCGGWDYSYQWRAAENATC